MIWCFEPLVQKRAAKSSIFSLIMMIMSSGRVGRLQARVTVLQAAAGQNTQFAQIDRSSGKWRAVISLQPVETAAKIQQRSLRRY